jgi:L-Ala-D/L-Glu epimerase
MSNRRDFLKTAAFAALGSGMAINHVFAGGNDAPSLFNVNSRAGVTPKMKLRFFPYELKLRHVFTVATYSRTTTIFSALFQAVSSSRVTGCMPTRCTHAM